MRHRTNESPYHRNEGSPGYLIRSNEGPIVRVLYRLDRRRIVIGLPSWGGTGFGGSALTKHDCRAEAARDFRSRRWTRS